MYIMKLILDKKGNIKGSFSIDTFFITDGKIATCGSSYHLTVRKDVAELIGPGKRIGVILFKQGAEDA